MDEVTAILIGAQSEIISLRRANEIYAAKQEMIDLFATVLFTKAAYQSKCESIDICWEINELIAKRNNQQKSTGDIGNG